MKRIRFYQIKFKNLVIKNSKLKKISKVLALFKHAKKIREFWEKSF